MGQNAALLRQITKQLFGDYLRKINDKTEKPNKPRAQSATKHIVESTNLAFLSHAATALTTHYPTRGRAALLLVRVNQLRVHFRISDLQNLITPRNK
jgi:ribosomal protein S15P/S13E